MELQKAGQAHTCIHPCFAYIVANASRRPPWPGKGWETTSKQRGGGEEQRGGGGGQSKDRREGEPTSW